MRGPLKPLPQTLRKRIPRVNLLQHKDNSDAKVIARLTSLLASNVPPVDALASVQPQLDPATFDECCIAAASSLASEKTPLNQWVHLFEKQLGLGPRLGPLLRACELPRINQSRPALEILGQQIPGYPSNNYYEFYDSMNEQEQKEFDKIADEFNLSREAQLENAQAVPLELEFLLERWTKALKFQNINGFDYLSAISDQIPAVVATILVRIAAQMLAVRFPQSLTSLCRRVGFAIESTLLSEVAKRNNVKASYARSHYLWAVLGANRWTAKDHISVGSVYILQALHKCTIDQKHPNKPGVTPRPAFWHTFFVEGKNKRGIVKINPALSLLVPDIQPDRFSHLPMLVPPTRWRTFRDGGYVLPQGQTFFPIANTQAVEQRVHVDDALKSDSMAKNLDGIESLAKTAWSVNAKVLEVVKSMFESKSDLSDLPAADDKPESTLERMQHENGLKIASALANGQKFWLPLYQDFRGRVYPMAGTKFSFMGSDSMRALFQFWNSKALGPRGLDALYIHLANVYGKGTATTYEGRINWAKACLENIRLSATEPLTTAWWQEASKPFQTLAACFEIERALSCSDPAKFLSRLPIVQDGTCNGLQHYAALSYSEDGAPAVNMVSKSDPQDVYTAISKLVDDKEGVKLERSVVKRAVFATVYGQGTFGVSKGLHDSLEDAGMESEDVKNNTKQIGGPLARAVTEGTTDAARVQSWLKRMGQRILMARRADIPVGATTIKWTTPLGLPVVQAYGRSELMAIRTPLQAFYLQSPFHPVSADKMKQLRALPANYIHSLDASHLLLTAIAMRNSGHEIAAVHDGFWTHAGTADHLAKILREQFVSLHETSQLEALKEEWEKTYAGYMVLVNVHASSETYDALQRWRYGTLPNGARKKPKVDLEEELMQEYTKIQSGSEMKTASDIVKAVNESIDWSLNSSPRIGYEHTHKTQVWLPLEFDQPPRGTFDIRQVLDADYFFT